jgi:7,8-dihydropterin-6-yl-methyl-4-(beta-D-ribofuranosyl)aminobenzene 5'-phosphate synthase
MERLPDGAVMRVLAPLRLTATIGVTGPIPRETAHEDAGGPFFLDQRGDRRDAIEDDQALWISTPEGLIVCVGCSHAGLINTLNCVRKVSGISGIRAVIGGFHLCQANERRMEMTLNALRSLSPGMIAPCHCTGEGAVRAIEDGMDIRVVRCHAGLRLRFPKDTAGEECGSDACAINRKGRRMMA